MAMDPYARRVEGIRVSSKIGGIVYERGALGGLSMASAMANYGVMVSIDADADSWADVDRIMLDVGDQRLPKTGFDRLHTRDVVTWRP